MPIAPRFAIPSPLPASVAGLGASTEPGANPAINKALLSQAAGKADTVMQAPVAGAVVAAANGDAFGLANAARKVLSGAPALAPLALAADVLVLSTSNQKAAKNVSGLAKSLDTLGDEGASQEQKLDAGLSLAATSRDMITTASSVGSAAKSVGTLVDQAAPSAGLTNSLENLAAKVQAGPLAPVLSGLKKVVPLLGLASTGMALKNAKEIFDDPDSDAKTRMLALGSAALNAAIAVTTTVAALNPATLPLAIGGIGVELALYQSRQEAEQKADRQDLEEALDAAALA